MKVIPVIDILNKTVVHAVKGIRSQYRPINSDIIKSTIPLEVVKSLQALGFQEIYIADLDAIIDCSTGFSYLKQIAKETRLSLMIDAGITNFERAQELLETGISKLVIGTETLTSKKFLEEAISKFGDNRVVLSLDLKGEKIIIKPEFDIVDKPLILLQEFQVSGIKQVIILDLERVGSETGVDMDFLEKALELGLDVYVGGGVRNILDLIDLEKLGVKGALIGTALHTGKISIEDLKIHNFI